jgi:hypothetical protein
MLASKSSTISGCYHPAKVAAGVLAGQLGRADRYVRVQHRLLHVAGGLQEDPGVEPARYADVA